MATYLELFDLKNENSILQKVEVAIAVAADVIRTESGATPNHANRLIWAKGAFSDPHAMAERFVWAALAANKGSSEAAILAATDAAFQANVNAVVDVFADGS